MRTHNQKVLLVGIKTKNISRRDMDVSLDELKRLVDTAKGKVSGTAYQEIKQITPATFIGKGKAEELKLTAEELRADLIVIDTLLSPVQNRNLEKITGKMVIDRPAVILDIFAQRARTMEGKLQVELAQLKYLAPRLTGRGEALSQQTGGIGTSGPGETQLEMDRRKIKTRISFLQKSLENVRHSRQMHRKKRESVPLPIVSLVGYTNAGKSTLMNALTNANVFVENKLFATLDPTVKRLKLPSGREILLVDTVGFIRNLPHQLIEAFKATFEETASSDLILKIIDASDIESNKQKNIVDNVLEELELNKKPCLTVGNKFDLKMNYHPDKDDILISATNKINLEALLSKIDEELSHNLISLNMLIPHDMGSILSEIHNVGHIINKKHTISGTHIKCMLPEKHAKKFAKYST